MQNVLSYSSFLTRFNACVSRLDIDIITLKLS